MTTKNLEFEFDLQTFALPNQVTIQSGGTSTNPYISVVGSDTATSDTAAGTPVVIDTDTNVTSQTDTITSSSAVYNFSGDTSSVNEPVYISTGTDSTITPVYAQYDLDGALIDSDTGTSTTSKAENTTISSPLWLAGGGDATNITIQGLGAISNFDDGNNKISITRLGNSSLGLNGVVGDVTIAPVGTAFNQTLTANNGAVVHASMAAGNNLAIHGSSGAGPTLSASAEVSLSSIDTIQTWVVTNTNALDYNRLQVKSTSATETVGVTGDESGSYLDASVAIGYGIELNTLTGSGLVDLISVNDTVIGGAGRTKAIVTAAEEDLMTVKVTNGGVITSGATLEGGLANLKDGATATITAEGITAVDTLANNGNWVLGDNATSAQLGRDTVTFTAAGSTITADSDGTKVRTLANFTSQVTLGAVDDHTLNVGGAAWTITGADSDAQTTAIFNSTGNVTLSAGSDKVLKGGTAGKTLAIGTNGDTLTMAANEVVTIGSDSAISSVSTVEAGTSWLVRGGSNRNVVAGQGSEAIGVVFDRADSSSVYGSLSKTTVSGSGSGVINSIESLSGNVTVSHDNSNLAMDVMGTNWTVANEDDQTVIFDSTGNSASLGATSSDDLSVTAASTDATVNIITMEDTVSGGAYAMTGTFNGTTINAQDSDGIIAVQLESDTVSAGISAITGLNSGATVTGDNQFNVNGVFDIYKSGTASSAKTQFTLGSNNSAITIQGVANGDNYSVTSANRQAIVYDIDSSVAAGGSAAVTVNTAAVTVTASTASKVGDAYIVSGTDGSDIVSVGGVKANDTVQSSDADKKFTVTFDTSDITDDAAHPAVLAVNRASVSLTSANLTSSGQSSLSMTVDDSGDIPYVTIGNGVIAENVTVTVGSGVYNIGSSAPVTINDSFGYLYSNDGNVTAEDNSVAYVRQMREQEMQKLLSNVTTPSSGTAFYDFENIYYGQNAIFGSLSGNSNKSTIGTVAHYANATVTTVSSTSSSDGVNIIGDTSLGAYPNSVTLQSYLPNAINITHMAGSVGSHVLNNVVIDVSNSTNTLVAVGVTSDDDTINATNHTIWGSGRQSTLLIGEYATGDNVVMAGDGGNYIYHKSTGGVASLSGGSGSDTIYASEGDHVEGGSGSDLFYDTNAIEISDYNFEQGDIIIATKLSSTAALGPANLSLSGNQIAIAGGSTITVGSSDDYDESTANRAVIANASGSTTSANTNFLVWSGLYDSYLDASEFTKGAIMISSINGGAVNSVVGSAYVDTIYAGANDVVYSGAGNDYIYLGTADSDAGERGATVLISEGRNIVYGWTSGFDNEAGANILQASAADVTLKTNRGAVVAASDGGSITFGDLSADSTGAYNFLIGNDRVSFLASNATVNVNSNDDIAGYYKAEKAGGIYVGSDVDAAFGVTLGSDNFSNITSINLQNESRASVIGSSEKETIKVGGSADQGAVKTVMSGGGNDLIISGGSGSDSTKSGHYLYFGEYNGDTFSSGNNTIQSFSFYGGSEADANVSSADLLILGDSRNFGGVSAVTSSKVELSLGDDTKVVIADTYTTSNSDNKIVRARFSDSDTVFNCKFGLTSSRAINTFTYDGETNVFFGNGNYNQDVLNVSSEVGNVNIWLGNKEVASADSRDNNLYSGISVLNASSVTDTKATLVGNDNSNMIYAANGTGSSSSLWGGGGQGNTLIGGTGADTFFYGKNFGYTDSDGNFHASNDVISGVTADDTIWLFDVAAQDINLEATANGIGTNSVDVTLNDGTVIKATGVSGGANFKLSDGSTYTAVVGNSSTRHWE